MVSVIIEQKRPFRRQNFKALNFQTKNILTNIQLSFYNIFSIRKLSQRILYYCFNKNLNFLRKNKIYNMNVHHKTKRSTFFNQKTRKNMLTTGCTICSQKYVLSHNIGKGTFGEVYIGLLAIDNTQSGVRLPRQVAIKVENDSSKSSQLSNEIEILGKLSSDPDLIPGFPEVYNSGSEGGNYFMVMELLGPNLQDLMTLCGGKFSLKTSLLLAIQVLEKIQFLHEKGYVYRDIKPENFTMGIEDKSSELFLIDFGLCRSYKDAKTGLFIPYKENVPMIGTIRYASLNSHLGIEQTRRDDLQAVLYMLVYFLKGQLPWQSLKIEDKFQKDHIIMQAKLKVSTKSLCQGLPFEIHNVFDYIKSLDFYQDPDYKYIMAELSSLYERMGYVLDFQYDWTMVTKSVKHQRGDMRLELRMAQDEVESDIENDNENQNEKQNQNENESEMESHSQSQSGLEITEPKYSEDMISDLIEYEGQKKNSNFLNV